MQTARQRLLVDPRNEPGTLTSSTDGFLVGLFLLAVVFIAAVDARDFVDKGGAYRYGLIVLPVLGVILVRIASGVSVMRVPAPVDWPLAVLFGVGVIGTTVGVLVRGTHATARPIIVPMVIGLLSLFTLRSPSERESRILGLGLVAVGVAYTFIGALAYQGVLGSVLEYRHFRNNADMFVALGFAAALALRARWSLVWIVLFAALMFKGYPSATFAVTVVVTAVTLWLTRPGVRFRDVLRSKVTWALGAIAAVGAALVALHPHVLNRLGSSYFSAVGKKNNTSFRLALWKQGWQRFTSSPVVGNVFSGSITVPKGSNPLGSRLGMRLTAPLHNDYLMFLVEGGVVALALFVGWLVASDVWLLRRYRAFLATGETNKAAVVRAVVVAINAFAVTAAFNPVLEGAGTSASFFAVWGIGMLVARSPVRARADRAS